MHMISVFIATGFFFLLNQCCAIVIIEKKPKLNFFLLTHVNEVLSKLNLDCGSCLVSSCPEGGNISLRIFGKMLAFENDNVSQDVVLFPSPR